MDCFLVGRGVCLLRKQEGTLGADKNKVSVTAVLRSSTNCVGKPSRSERRMYGSMISTESELRACTGVLVDGYVACTKGKRK